MTEQIKVEFRPAVTVTLLARRDGRLDVILDGDVIAKIETRTPEFQHLVRMGQVPEPFGANPAVAGVVKLLEVLGVKYGGLGQHT